jgi:hypothetical protein
LEDQSAQKLADRICKYRVKYTKEGRSVGDQNGEQGLLIAHQGDTLRPAHAILAVCV